LVRKVILREKEKPFAEVPMPDLEEQIPLVEAARLARLSYTKSWRLCLTGIWKAQRAQGHWLVSKESVEQWVRAHQRDGAA